MPQRRFFIVSLHHIAAQRQSVYGSAEKEWGLSNSGIPVSLPSELDEADLFAVARIHFRDLSDDYLQYVVSKALATERNYVSDIAKIARHANDYAQENGRKRPILADIESAIADVLPVTTRAPESTIRAPVRPPRKTPVQTRCNGAAEAMPEPRTTFETPPQYQRRSLSPAEMTP